LQIWANGLKDYETQGERNLHNDERVTCMSVAIHFNDCFNFGFITYHAGFFFLLLLFQ